MRDSCGVLLRCLGLGEMARRQSAALALKDGEGLGINAGRRGSVDGLKVNVG